MASRSLGLVFSLEYRESAIVGGFSGRTKDGLPTSGLIGQPIPRIGDRKIRSGFAAKTDCAANNPV